MFITSDIYSLSLSKLITLFGGRFELQGNVISHFEAGITKLLNNRTIWIKFLLLSSVGFHNLSKYN